MCFTISKSRTFSQNTKSPIYELFLAISCRSCDNTYKESVSSISALFAASEVATHSPDAASCAGIGSFLLQTFAQKQTLPEFVESSED